MFEFGLRSPYNNWLFIKGLHDYSRKRNVRISLTCILIKPLERALFKIIGMYCASCKSIVEKQLKEENAIKRIDIDYLTDTVFVEFETSLITKEEIKRRLEKSGYKFVRVAH